MEIHKWHAMCETTCHVSSDMTVVFIRILYSYMSDFFMRENLVYLA